jgi:hypothetical protein
MKVMLFFIMTMALCITSAIADTQYNVFTRKWETVPADADYTEKYNAFTNKWSLQPRDAEPEYNAFERKWEWDSGRGNREE